jgi:hypothetical protein
MKIAEIYAADWHRNSRPPDIIDFLISRGGLLDQGGELRAMDLNRVRKGQFGILSTRRGMTLDHAREAAEEAGYLKRDSYISDLLSAIQATALGAPVYRPEDAVVWRENERNRLAQQLQDQTEEDLWNPNNAFADL